MEGPGDSLAKDTTSSGVARLTEQFSELDRGPPRGAGGCNEVRQEENAGSADPRGGEAEQRGVVRLPRGTRQEADRDLRLKELYYDRLYMKGRVSWPEIEREFDVARRMVGKERGWGVYREVRRRRKREADLAAQHFACDLEEFGPERAQELLQEREQRRVDAAMRRSEREEGTLKPRSRRTR